MKNATKRILSFLLVLLLALTAAACAEESVNTEPSYERYDETETVPAETSPPVQITMPEYEFTYTGELKDVIVLEELEDKTGLKFDVVLSTGQQHIFTLYYNSDQGDLVEVLTDSQGNRIPVAFDMAAIPEDMEEADATLFYTAQEAVNEIVRSLILK